MVSSESNQQPAQQTKPLFGSRAAKISVLMPVISAVLNAAAPQIYTREGKLLFGGIQFGLIVIGFILAVFVLCRIKIYGKKGVLGWAVAGAAVNGLLIAAFLALLPAMIKVKRHFAEVYGYTQEQMEKMPEVIPGSTKIIDNTIGFRIEIPQGFEPFLAAESSTKTMYSYRMLQTDGSAVAVGIMRLKCKIGQVALGPEALESIRMASPEGAKISASKQRWGDYTVDVIRTEMDKQGQKVVALVVQIPLAREAIQIYIVGSLQYERQCLDLLSDLLKSLKGKSNWSTSLQQPAV